MKKAVAETKCASRNDPAAAADGHTSDCHRRSGTWPRAGEGTLCRVTALAQHGLADVTRSRV